MPHRNEDRFLVAVGSLHIFFYSFLEIKENSFREQWSLSILSREVITILNILMAWSMALWFCECFTSTSAKKMKLFSYWKCQVK